MNIGISARNLYIDDKKKKFINETYLSFLKEFNLTPILITSINDVEILGKYCSLFLLTGGDDINPLLYNEKNISSYNVDQEMDLLDFKIIEYCEKYKKPLLGICRGLQSINVYFGGSLNQNINEIHYHNEAYLIINKSRFFPYLNHKKIKINSYHHQGIKLLGKNLLQVGKSHKIIELIEHKYLPIIGMQFHLELLNNNLSKKMFQSFINLGRYYERFTSKKDNVRRIESSK